MWLLSFIWQQFSPPDCDPNKNNNNHNHHTGVACSHKTICCLYVCPIVTVTGENLSYNIKQLVRIKENDGESLTLSQLVQVDADLPGVQLRDLGDPGWLWPTGSSEGRWFSLEHTDAAGSWKKRNARRVQHICCWGGTDTKPMGWETELDADAKAIAVWHIRSLIRRF